VIVGLGGVAGARLEPVRVSSSGSFSMGAFAVSLVWVSFSYSGWNAAVYMGGEIREPERNLPRAMWLGAALVTFLYLALNSVFVYAVPAEKLAGKLEVARIATEALGGAPFANFVTALIALALATSVSSMLMAGPRVYARMADDGCLPSWLRHPPQGPPRAAILFQTVLALAMLWTVTFKALLTYIGFTLGLCTAAAVAGLIRMRLRQGSKVPVPGWPWVPVIFVVAVSAITVFTMARQPVTSALGLATAGFGLAAWRFTSRTRRQTGLSSGT